MGSFIVWQTTNWRPGVQWAIPSHPAINKWHKSGCQNCFDAWCSVELGMQLFFSSITFAWRMMRYEVRASAMGARRPCVSATNGNIHTCSGIAACCAPGGLARTACSSSLLPGSGCVWWFFRAWVEVTLRSTQICRSSGSLIQTSTLCMAWAAPGVSESTGMFRSRAFAIPAWRAAWASRSRNLSCRRYIPVGPVPSCTWQGGLQRGQVARCSLTVRICHLLLERCVPILLQSPSFGRHLSQTSSAGRPGSSPARLCLDPSKPDLRWQRVLAKNKCRWECNKNALSSWRSGWNFCQLGACESFPQLPLGSAQWEEQANQTGQTALSLRWNAHSPV